MALMDHPEPGRERKIVQCFMQLVPSYQASPSGLGRFLPKDEEQPAVRPIPAAGPGTRGRAPAWEFLGPE
jgi:hypothetical protein